jgi:ribosomal protein S20
MKSSELKKSIKEYIVEILSEEEEDREPTKAELEKEKVKGAPSKFKVPQSDFEDFKTKLKTLVKKIKDMEKGEERTKKMAALKQFIKKPELVKAFKERDVQIDTGDLIG